MKTAETAIVTMVCSPAAFDLAFVKSNWNWSVAASTSQAAGSKPSLSIRRHQPEALVDVGVLAPDESRGRELAEQVLGDVVADLQAVDGLSMVKGVHQYATERRRCPDCSRAVDVVGVGRVRNHAAHQS